MKISGQADTLTMADARLGQVIKADATRPAQSLKRALEQNEHVRDLVQEAADELAMVNDALKVELKGRQTPAEVEIALGKSEAVESKVQDASERLEVVNKALVHEVKDRHALEGQLADFQVREEAARHAAFHDPLTGLPNRALFEDRLAQSLAHARRHGLSLAVMFLDLDEFKAVNDTYGHEAGDRLLLTIAERLKANIRGDDTVSRHGGDEFLYMLIGSGGEREIALIARKLVTLIEAPCGIRLGDRIFTASVKASIGIAIHPQDGTTVQELIRSADAAMYRAKRAGSGHAFTK